MILVGLAMFFRRLLSRARFNLFYRNKWRSHAIRYCRHPSFNVWGSQEKPVEANYGRGHRFHFHRHVGAANLEIWFQVLFCWLLCALPRLWLYCLQGTAVGLSFRAAVLKVLPLAMPDDRAKRFYALNLRLLVNFLVTRAQANTVISGLERYLFARDFPLGCLFCHYKSGRQENLFF